MPVEFFPPNNPALNPVSFKIHAGAHVQNPLRDSVPLKQSLIRLWLTYEHSPKLHVEGILYNTAFPRNSSSNAYSLGVSLCFTLE